MATEVTEEAGCSPRVGRWEEPALGWVIVLGVTVGAPVGWTFGDLDSFLNSTAGGAGVAIVALWSFGAAWSEQVDPVKRRWAVVAAEAIRLWAPVVLLAATSAGLLNAWSGDATEGESWQVVAIVGFVSSLVALHVGVPVARWAAGRARSGVGRWRR